MCAVVEHFPANHDPDARKQQLLDHLSALSPPTPVIKKVKTLKGAAVKMSRILPPSPPSSGLSIGCSTTARSLSKKKRNRRQRLIEDRTGLDIEGIVSNDVYIENPFQTASSASSSDFDDQILSSSFHVLLSLDDCEMML